MASLGSISMKKLWVLLGFCCFALLSMVDLVSSSSSKFDELFQASWANDHFVYEGDEVLKMKLDYNSGII